MTATEIFVKEICCYPIKYRRSKAMRIDLIDTSGERITFTLWDYNDDKKELDAIPDVLLNALKDFERWIKKGRYPKTYIKDNVTQKDTMYHQ